MVQRLEDSLIRILGKGDVTCGAGFLVAPDLAVTCAHVVEMAGSGPGRPISIRFCSTGTERLVEVQEQGWSPPNADDMAFLQLVDAPIGIVPVVLGSAESRQGHDYATLGFAGLAGYVERWADDKVGGIVPGGEGRAAMLQLRGEAIKEGMSGAPVLDLQVDRVIGMISEFADDRTKPGTDTRFAWATTADTLASRWEGLQCWPDSYGPSDLQVYLDHVIQTNGTVTLVGGQQVPLDRIYVPLQADVMSVSERQAKQVLYLEAVERIWQTMKDQYSDEYAAFASIRRAIMRDPHAHILEKRRQNRSTEEGERSLLDLASVMESDRDIILLGDPGSGKTTLAKWLVVQFAQAMRSGQRRVLVMPEFTRTQQPEDAPVDMGAARLPVLVHVADYARARWGNEKIDTGLKLDRFIETPASQILSPGPKLQVVSNLIRDFVATGRALIVLDGLDEVSDSNQRRIVANELRQLMSGQIPIMFDGLDETVSDQKRSDTDGLRESQGPRTHMIVTARGGDFPHHRPSISVTSGTNRFVVTSRITGYQFEPLDTIPHYVLEDMEKPDIEDFCQRWMLQVAKLSETVATQWALKLTQEIFYDSHPSVRAMAGNPLLLSILAQVYWSNTQHSLPARRVDLFKQAVKAFYSQRARFWKQVGISLAQLVNALAAVAMHIQSIEVAGFAEEGTVRAELAQVLVNTEQVDAMVEAARDVSGFLVARGEGAYGFVHRAFQEYFAAEYLVAAPDRLDNNLAQHGLEPEWREPLIMAIGITSKPSTPQSLARLRRALSTLLDLPDPVGEYLPRRELVAAAACAECERLPQDLSERIADRLWRIYHQNRSSAKPQKLRNRITQAFVQLRDSPARDGVEELLQAGAVHVAPRVRQATAALIHYTQWDSPNAARALIDGLQLYADPAATFIWALDQMMSRQREAFGPISLPLRDAVMAEPILWEVSKSDSNWQRVISLLYLPAWVPYEPANINRDSPLTPSLLAALRQLPADNSLATLHSSLVALTSSTGLPALRDAALALSAIGDTSWIKAYLDEKTERKQVLYTLLACFSRASQIADAFIRDRNLVVSSGIAAELASVVVSVPKSDAPSVLEPLLKRLVDNSHSALSVILKATGRLTRGLDSGKDIGKLAGDVLRNADHDIEARRDLIERIVLAIDFTRTVGPADFEINRLLDQAEVELRTAQWKFELFANLSKVGVVLADEIVRYYPAPDKPPEPQSDQLSLCSVNVDDVATDLVSRNDTIRLLAHKTMFRSILPASAIGRVTIERMAEHAQSLLDRPLAGPVLRMGLHVIEHDEPEWVREWIAQAAASGETTPARMILSSMRRATASVVPVVMDTIEQRLPLITDLLLEDMRWWGRLGYLQAAGPCRILDRLFGWLDRDTEPATYRSLIGVLEQWQESPELVAESLITRIRSDHLAPSNHLLYKALGRLAGRADHRAKWKGGWVVAEEERVQAVLRIVQSARSVLQSAVANDEAAAGLVCMELIREIGEHRPSPLPSVTFAGRDEMEARRVIPQLLSAVTQAIPDPERCLLALLQAGEDEESWNLGFTSAQDGFHALLVQAACAHLQTHPGLLPLIAVRLRTASRKEAWPVRRMILAVMDGCLASMPLTSQRFWPRDLSSILNEASRDAGSEDCRRFALMALGHFRRVTPAVARAFLDACVDVASVQEAARNIAGQFEVVEDECEVLEILIPMLTDESVGTAWAVSRLLGALAASATMESSVLRNRIIEALVMALKDPRSQIELPTTKDTYEGRQRLDDALFGALLQATGF